MNKYTELIYELVKSFEFKAILENICINYPNLKQELFIRNAILKTLNTGQSFNLDQSRAFAEHPRGIKGSRVDLSIVEKSNPNNPFLVEFKYQFPFDIIAFDYSKSIERDFVRQKAKEKKTDLFILIMALWNSEEKQLYDSTWNIDSNLSRYQNLSHDKNGRYWESILISNFDSITEGTLLPKISHKINLPYFVEYDIYFFERRNME